MNCASHPDIETKLRCSKCGKPICLRCLVQTPVGGRCPNCAHMAKLPTFHVPAKYYFRAFGAALGMVIACGIIWGFLTKFIAILIPSFYINLILAPASGLAIGEVTSMAVNRKRSKGLAAIAGIAVMISFLLTLFFTGIFRLSLFNISYDVLALALGIFITVTRLR